MFFGEKVYILRLKYQPRIAKILKVRNIYVEL